MTISEQWRQLALDACEILGRGVVFSKLPPVSKADACRLFEELGRLIVKRGQRDDREGETQDRPPEADPLERRAGSARDAGGER